MDFILYCSIVLTVTFFVMEDLSGCLVIIDILVFRKGGSSVRRERGLQCLGLIPGDVIITGVRPQPTCCKMNVVSDDCRD